MKTSLSYITITLLAVVLVPILFSYKASRPLLDFNDTFDFGLKKTGTNWNVMNDGVMGGLSKGSATLTDNSLILTGEISLANNGGFSSIRSPWETIDLSAFSQTTIRYRSKGQVVAMCFEPNKRWWRPYYLLDLQPTDGEWKTVTLELGLGKKYSIAKPRSEGLNKEVLKEILRFGFMTNDKKECSFEFEVDFVTFK